MWQNSKTKNVRKLKQLNLCQKIKMWQNSKWNKTQKLKMWQNSKTQMWHNAKTQNVTRLKTINMWQNIQIQNDNDNTQKLNCDKTQKLNLWQKSETRIRRNLKIKKINRAKVFW